MFKEMDADEDGRISIDELKLKLEQMQGAPVSRSTVEKFIKQHDADGDTYWSLVELAKFVEQNS